MTELPQTLPKALQDLIGDSTLVRNTLGCSGAVVIHVQDRHSYLKIAPYNELEPLAYKAAVLQWLEDKVPVPKVHYYTHCEDWEYLLISEIAGIDCSSVIYEANPETMVRSLAEGLRQMHSLDIASCPFDQTLGLKLEKARLNMERGLVDEENFEEEYQGRTTQELYKELLARRPLGEDLVFTHGDYCLPNVILKDGRLAGFIDLGRAGVADRYQDIVLAVRSLRHNVYSEELVHLFLEAYGLSDPDWEKIEYYILLDEFF